MKIAWLVWQSWDDKNDGAKPELWTTEPDSWYTSVRIVYAEIVE
jgi:hypothetical protein